MLPFMTRTVQTRLEYQPLVFGKTIRENKPPLARPDPGDSGNRANPKVQTSH